MVISNLDVLLAERKLKISTVSNDTGISRTTLTALSSGRAQGIQFDTLNTLCSYLRVEPSDLLMFVPYDFDISKTNCTFNGDDAFTINFELCANSRLMKQERFNYSADFSYNLDKKILRLYQTYHIASIKNFFATLPREVQTVVEDLICDTGESAALDYISHNYDTVEPNVTVML